MEAPDPLADLRTEPTDEERFALRMEMLEQEMEDALRDGEHVHFAWTNVGAGRGYAVHSLWRQGYMASRYEPGPDGGKWRYTPTVKPPVKRL